MIEKLRRFEDEQVKLIDIDGDVFVGYCSDYFFPEDNSPDFEEDAIALYCPTKNGNTLYQNPVVFNNSEIASIEIIA